MLESLVKRLEEKYSFTLTRKEVMEVLNISRSTIKRWEKTGELKPISNIHKPIIYSTEYIARVIESKDES